MFLYCVLSKEQFMKSEQPHCFLRGLTFLGPTRINYVALWSSSSHPLFPISGYVTLSYSVILLLFEIMSSKTARLVWWWALCVSTSEPREGRYSAQHYSAGICEGVSGWGNFWVGRLGKADGPRTCWGSPFHQQKIWMEEEGWKRDLGHRSSLAFSSSWVPSAPASGLELIPSALLVLRGPWTQTGTTLRTRTTRLH